MFVAPYIFKSALFHVILAIIYVSFTGYKFVTASSADPIGMGIMQWIFFFVHLIVGCIIALTIFKKRISTKHWASEINLQLCLVTGVFLINLLLSGPISDMLWNLRGQ